MVQTLTRAVSLLIGLVLLGVGAVGLALAQLPQSALAGHGHVWVARASSLLGALLGAPLPPRVVEGFLAGPIVSLLLPLAGVALLWNALRRRGGRVDPDEAAGDDRRTTTDRSTRRRTEREAESLAKKGHAAEAADLFCSIGLLDRAAETLIRSEQFVRAAEIRHDQNRFLESAELYERAGRFELAGTILAGQNEHARAAENFVKAARLSVAAENFEKAGDFARAGECYAEVGFHRHAAQAFVHCQRWEKAARSLEEVIQEESSRSNAGQDPRRQKEFRTLVLQAGKLYVQAEQLERAQAVLERGGCLVASAEIALRLERFAKAAELFQRAQDPLRAAEALRRLGEHAEAARILGEYHRDRGEDEEAARAFEEAGDFLAAGDLYRKSEEYEKAGACYERQGDLPLAAEMYLSAGDHARAAAAYERAGRFAEAAECAAAVGNQPKHADLLAQAGELLRAGEAFHRSQLDDDAIKVLQRVEATSPDFAAASALLGEIFRAKGMLSLSIKKFKQATGNAELSRENVSSFYALATVHEMAGELREAIDIYEKILAFDYHHADVEQRLAAARTRFEASLGVDLSVSGAPGRATGPVPGGPARYQILEELGRGGMGIVFKAKDTVLDRVVAYKVLPDALKENPQALKNFLREAKSAAQLNHPNIVTVYDAGEQDGRYYIAMEFVDGTTLKEILRRRGAIAPNGVMHVLYQMCEALAYAHDKKIVHRDIKTGNTMWTRDKKAKIMDFGLAKVVEEVRNHTTLVSGTPYYMSPEQTLGRNVDHRTDIYSLGVTIFELATGTLPFRDGNVPYHHVHTPAPDVRTVNAHVPPVVAQIVARCLQKDPERRYGSTREILAELRAAPAVPSSTSAA